MSNKPTVFNYREYVDALKRIEELEAEKALLKNKIDCMQMTIDSQNKKLANLEIKCRILEEDSKR